MNSGSSSSSSSSTTPTGALDLDAHYLVGRYRFLCAPQQEAVSEFTVTEVNNSPIPADEKKQAEGVECHCLTYLRGGVSARVRGFWGADVVASILSHCPKLNIRWLVPYLVYFTLDALQSGALVNDVPFDELYEMYKENEAKYDKIVVGEDGMVQLHAAYAAALAERDAAHDEQRSLKRRLKKLHKQRATMEAQDHVPADAKADRLQKLQADITTVSLQCFTANTRVIRAKTALQQQQEQWLCARALFFASYDDNEYDAPGRYRALLRSVAGRVQHSVRNHQVTKLFDIDQAHRGAIVQNVIYVLSVLSRVLVGIPPMGYIENLDAQPFPIMPAHDLLEVCLNEVDPDSDDVEEDEA